MKLVNCEWWDSNQNLKMPDSSTRKFRGEAETILATEVFWGVEEAGLTR